MSWIEALILGLIQGLTEFLPVSSSGHLQLGAFLFSQEPTDNLLFAVVVHLATALSTVFVYRRDIGGLLSGLLEFKRNDSWNFVVLILISMVPVAIVGVFFQDEVEAFFQDNIMLVGFMLLLTAALLTLSHFYKSGTGAVSPIKAIVIGLAQAIAVLPGISRSGATISTALLLGVDREKAARFSFLMVIIPIVGAAILKMKDYLEAPDQYELSLLSLIVSFLAAFVSGVFACRWMVKLVTKGSLIYFAIYCGIIGTITIILSL